MKRSRSGGIREILALIPFGLGFLGLGGTFGFLVWSLSTGQPFPLMLFVLMSAALVLLLAGHALRPPPRPPSFLAIVSPLQFAPVILVLALGRSVLEGTPVSAAPVVAAIALAGVAAFLGRSLGRHGLSYSAWWG
jgi:hypothetical protein